MIGTVPGYLKEQIEALPKKPGVYIFKERGGEPIYVGKALSIQKRVKGHFRFFGEDHSKEGVMLSQVSRIDLLETSNEAEALLLEASLIKEMMPKYNQSLKDDKSYPFLKITSEEYPRLLIVRGRKPDGGKYFGPYTGAYLLRQAVKMLRIQFPLRTCRRLPAKVCLLYHIGQCGGPCQGLQDKESYLKTVKELGAFLEGRRDALVRNLSKRMKESASRKEFEQAQVLLQQMKALSSLGSVKTARREPELILAALKEALSLPKLPLRMECFDVSNIQGSESVASMVTFLNGKPARSDYRRFRIKTVRGIDDYRMIREVVRRRYSGSLSEKMPWPDLVVIDGGKGHLASALTELESIGLADLPVISIAKEHEHIFMPHRSGPKIFSSSAPELQVLRHLRDEAHRFAIRYHRHLHRKKALE